MAFLKMVCRCPGLLAWSGLGRPQAGRLGWVAGLRARQTSPGRAEAGRLGSLPGLRARRAGPGLAEAGLPVAPLPASPLTSQPHVGLPARRKKAPTAKLLEEGYKYPSTYLQPF